MIGCKIRVQEKGSPRRELRRKLVAMLLRHAVESDYAAIVDLANQAYRGTGPVASWNIETGIIAGQRLTESLLIEDLAAKPEAHLLIGRDDRDEQDRTLLGTVWLEPKSDSIWYLGLLTVRPDLQKAPYVACIDALPPPDVSYNAILLIPEPGPYDFTYNNFMYKIISSCEERDDRITRGLQ